MVGLSFFPLRSVLGIKVPTTVPTLNINSVNVSSVNTSALTNSAYATTQQTTLKAINASQTAVTNVNTVIKQSPNLSEQQKNQLYTCTAMTIKRLDTYETAVQNSKNATELATATKTLKDGIVADKDAIKNCVNTAAMIGVKELIDANKIYLDYAANASKILSAPPCKANTASLDTLIQQGQQKQKQLEDSYNTIFADGKVTVTDQNAVVLATKTATEKAVIDDQLYTQAMTILGSCGYPTE